MKLKSPSEHGLFRLHALAGGSRFVVNREVQVRRNRAAGGIPERVDIQVDAFGDPHAGPRVITVPIEVKGAWNRDLTTSLESQLVEQYMADLGASHGVYLVVWPDITSWKGTSSSRSRTAARDRQATMADLLAQAEALRAQDIHVKVIDLSIEYLRPQG